MWSDCAFVLGSDWTGGENLIIWILSIVFQVSVKQATAPALSLTLNLDEEYNNRLHIIKAYYQYLPFSFATSVPEAGWSGDVAGPQGGLLVITVEHQHHVIGRLERT